MNNYFALDFKFDPFSEDAADLLAAFLADVGFESFTSSPPVMTGFIKEENFIPSEIEDIISEFPIDTEITFSKELIEGQDWNHEWEKNYFKPIIIDDKVVIHSSFHENPPKATYQILIDPKMAFGTGHHATTSMMVSHLLSNNLIGKNIIDMGTGTGILAILSLMLGASEATGIEIDTMAYQNTIENGKLNNSNAKFICGDASVLKSLKKAHILLANINRNVILDDIDKYAEALLPSGELILSGFYPQDIPLITEAANNYGLELMDTLQRGEWASIKLRRN